MHLPGAGEWNLCFYIFVSFLTPGTCGNSKIHHLMKQNSIGCPLGMSHLDRVCTSLAFLLGHDSGFFICPLWLDPSCRSGSRGMSEWDGSPGSLPRPETVDVTVQTDT